MKTYCNSFYIFFTLAILFAPSLAFKFNEKGEFTILQFTDFHYCELESLDDAIQNTQRKILELVKPDLSVISGDGLCPVHAFYWKVLKIHGTAERCWRKMTDPFIEAKVPYAYTLGNHDGDGDLNGDQIVELDQTNPYSLKNKMEGLPGSPTFYIPIFSQHNNQELAANIWILDTPRRDCMGTRETYGCIEKPVLDWYNEESANLKAKYGENVHHIAFFHVPVYEYTHIFNSDDFYGETNEKVCCPTVNTGFFDLAKKNGDISAMFVGHDHTNNFGGFHEGIELVYGQNSGHGSYGGVRGARVIKLKETIGEDGKRTVTREHYVIYEDGSIGSRVHNRITKRKSQDQCYKNLGEANISRWIETNFFEYLKYFIEFSLAVLLLLIIRKFWGTAIKNFVSDLTPKFNRYNKMDKSVEVESEVEIEGSSVNE